jgi:type I restriction enzyme, R subunit
MNNFYEDNLEKAVIEIFQHELEYEYQNGVDISCEGINAERSDYSSVILENRFFQSLKKINPHIPSDTLEDILRQILNLNSPLLIENNKTFHHYLTDGIDVVYKDNEGIDKGDKVYLFDFKNSSNNDFLISNQFTIKEHDERRPDLIIFINGLPLVVFELKSLSNEKIGLTQAYNQLQTYKNKIPTLFNTNAFMVISDGINAKVGTLSSNLERFSAWKSIDGKKLDSHIQIETMILGMFEKNRLLDIVRNFILFIDDGIKNIKILSAYHQYFAVKKAVDSTVKSIIEKSKKAGLIWHTQGSGKSLSMVFYTGCIVKEIKNPTVIVLTDRNDLDEQLFSTFSKAKDILRQTPISIKDKDDLREKLNRQSGGVLFTTIQKFALKEDEIQIDCLSDRRDIILIADEAHRSQYGLDAKVDSKTGKVTYGYAKHIRDALPNATFIGFTGTPIESSDKSTREIFGEEVDVYDMTQAVEDGSTVKIFYESRIAKLKLDNEVLKAIDKEYEKLEDEGAQSELLDQSKREFTKLEEIVGDSHRLEMLALDIVTHYEDREIILAPKFLDKAMIVCMNRKIAVKLYEQIIKIRPSWENKDLDKGKIKVIMTTNPSDDEILKQHETSKDDRNFLAKRIKDTQDELKIVIVVDMWLTGFDVPSMSTMYIDKPMKSHNLMQAIARVNRVFKDKIGGLVVDYIGIMSSLRDALQTYTKRDEDKIELNLDGVYHKLEDNLDYLRKLFVGLDYSAFFHGSDKDRLYLIGEGVEEVLALSYGEEEIKKEFNKKVSELNASQTLCNSLLDDKTKLEIAYFKAVRSALLKLDGKEFDLQKINQRVLFLVQNSIQKDSILELNDILGIKQSELDIFNEDFLNEIASMKRKNIALELLKRLLGDKIKGYERTNIVQSEKFSILMAEIMNKYNNKAITNAEVIDELLNMSKDMMKDFLNGNELGLSDEEKSFYDALTKFEGVKDVMKEEILKELAIELTKKIQNSKTIDWQYKDNARAKMRSEVKRLLKKYDYPPKNALEALAIVIRQVEISCSKNT